MSSSKPPSLLTLFAQASILLFEGAQTLLKVFVFFYRKIILRLSETDAFP